MSTSPETKVRSEDRLISVISHWLARHIGNAELQQGLEQKSTVGLTPSQEEAVRELAEELDKVEPGERGHVEMVARETIEVLGLGE
jgi:hypothetical protein